MFKPSLKRSKVEQIPSISSKTIQSIKTNQTNHPQLYQQQKQIYQISIPDFFSKNITFTSPSPNQQKLITPLNTWHLHYPYEVREKLNQPVQQVKSRIIGAKFGIYWLLTQNQLYLWRYNSLNNPTTLQLQRKFSFEDNLRALALGHFDSSICSLIANNDDCEMLVLGFDRTIHLYKINPTTLELSSLSTKITLTHNQTLQKLTITPYNQILYTTDQAQLSRISFHKYDLFGQSTIIISHTKPSLRSKLLWNSLQIIQNQPRVFSENVLSTKSGKIYVLVRKQHEISFINKLSKQAVRFFSGKIDQDQDKYRIQKQIRIYQLVEGRKESSLKYEGTITNYDIQKKIKQSYSANQLISKLFDGGNDKWSTNTIVNIYLNKNNKQDQKQQVQKLSLVTNYGLFLTIRQNVSNESSTRYTFSFDQQPKTLPKQLFHQTKKQQTMALFLRSKNSDTSPHEQPHQPNPTQLDPFLQPKSKIIYSLGMHNINLFQNGLCLFLTDTQQQLQFTKLDRYPGYIIQTSIYHREQELQQNTTWCVFAKNQITIIRKLDLYESLVTFIEAMNEVSKQGIANGENIQQYRRYINIMMEDISKIIGNGQICKGLCMLLLTIIRNKIGQFPQLSPSGQSLLFINNQLKQTIKQQIKIKMKLRNRFRSFQSTHTQQTCSLFSKWLTPNKKDNKLQQITITSEIESTIWQLFTQYSLQRVTQSEKIPYVNQNYLTFGNNYQNISVLSILLRNLFRFNYLIVKNMGITQLRNSPHKITQLKLNLLTLANFLLQKKTNSHSLTHKLLYYKSQLPSQPKYQKDDILNKTTDQITNDTLTHQQPLDKKDTTNTTNQNQLLTNILPTDTLTIHQSQNSQQQIQNQLQKLIHKLLNIISLYQLLAANTQRIYQYIPNIQNFLLTFTAKKQVKLALLDLFISTQLWNQPTIIKYSTILPQLRLQPDIYLSKWLKYIYQSNNQSMLLQTSNHQQLHITDLKQLSERLQLQQVIKIKYLFTESSPLYIKILINQLEMRKIQQNAKQMEIKQYDESSSNNSNTNNDTLIQKSIFAIDRLRTNTEWKQWITTQILNIRAQILTYLKDLSHQINSSQPYQYLKKQKLLQDCIKILQLSQEGLNFIRQLITYLQQNNLMPQKIYRLSLTVLPKNKISNNIILQPTKPEFMSSFTLLNNSIKRNREEILSQLNSSKMEQKYTSIVINGDSTSIL